MTAVSSSLLIYWQLIVP